MGWLAADAPTFDHAWIRILITIVAIAVLAATWFFPTKAKVDASGIALLVLALLPWIVPIMHITELDLGGNVIKLQDQIKELQKSKDLSDAEIKQIRELLRVTTNMARAQIGPNPDITSSESAETDVKIAELKASFMPLYNDRFRSTRLSDLTKVVAQLVPLMAQKTNFDPLPSLGSRDPADRIAAIAYIYGKPDWKYLDRLITAASGEDKPFIQYWAVEAIGAITALPGTHVSPSQMQALNALLPRVDNFFDHERYSDLSNIIQGIESVPPSPTK
jgi:hypothetical protein